MDLSNISFKQADKDKPFKIHNHPVVVGEWNAINSLLKKEFGLLHRDLPYWQRYPQWYTSYSKDDIRYLRDIYRTWLNDLFSSPEFMIYIKEDSQ